MAILEPPDFTLVPYRLLKSKIDTKTDSLCSYLDPKVGARRGLQRDLFIRAFFLGHCLRKVTVSWI